MPLARPILVAALLLAGTAPSPEHAKDLQAFFTAGS